MHMLKVVSITDAKRDRDANVEDVFAAYVAAKDKADATRRVEDGIAAARIWQRFLELFARAS